MHKGILLITVLASCAQPGNREDGRDDSFLSAGKADSGGVEDGSLDARAVLHVANTASEHVLAADVGLGDHAVSNIIAVRLGADGIAGTADDVTFDTLADLDAVPFVGPIAFDKLLAYARHVEHGWQPAAPISVARAELGVASTSDGVYAIGGGPEDEGSDLVERYTPATNEWVTLGPLPFKLGNPALAVLDDQIYLTGGLIGDHLGQQSQTGLFVYSASADSWSQVSELPPTRDVHAAVASGGRIYVFDSDFIDGDDVPQLQVDIYDPASGSWSTGTTLTTNLAAFAAYVAGADGRIYVIGGNAALQDVGTVQIYDPGSDTWTTGPTLAKPRAVPAAVAAPDGRLFVIGGFDDHAEKDLDVVEVLGPNADAWRFGPSLAHARSLLGAGLGSDGRIYAIGGNGRAPLASVEALLLCDY
jgi:N-acetylneuraminic acid mutarotase